jgi:uncharacterized protein (TIGR02001 family)
MKKTILALSLAAMTLPAMAQKTPEPDYTIEGNFGLFSDYRFRGISQTDLKAALQGGLDFTHKSGFYAGTWASNVADFANEGGNGMEIDFYAGYAFEVNGVGVDIGNLYYYYPGNQATTKQHANEIYVGLTYGPATLKTSYTTSKNAFGFEAKGTIYYDLSASHPLTETVSLNGHIGYLAGKKDTVSGTDYKIGLSTELGGYTLAADYVGNSGDIRDDFKVAARDLAKSALVLSVSKSF